MKIYRLPEFLKLPPGTMYCQGCRWTFGELQIKDETCARTPDWFYLAINWVEAENTDEAINLLESALKDGISIPMQETVGRDGLFNPDRLFLVYETDDLLKLQEYCAAAVAAQLKRGHIERQA